MFTGIVEEVGTVKSIIRHANSAVLTVEADLVTSDVNLGDSIAVNGICLTVTNCGKTEFSADIMPESLRHSSLGSLKNGGKVNLERAMPACGRFGGHFVSGHTDGTGRISRIRRESNAIWYTVKTKKNILKYIIKKGSVALDGVSLTVAELDDNSFSVSVIPHTIENTILPLKKAGDIVNIENDCVGKYIEKFMNLGKTQEKITHEYIQRFEF